jgi:radical SAM protein with 4Fe4S-binding SPASM domain
MSLDHFVRILDMLPHAYRITLVGLGEPLLHADVAGFVAEAAARGRRVALVTNAMCLYEQLASQLLKAGLASIAFSVDTGNQHMADAVREGSDMSRIFANIKGFIRQSSTQNSISTAVFSAVSLKTAGYLKQLVDAVADLGVHVLMITDLNFKRNVSETLWQNAAEKISTSIREGLRYACSKKLPVLSVHGLEEFGLWKRYRDYLLFSPDKVFQRSLKCEWCRSPWKTIAVDIDGNAAVCDCQPESQIGNILREPFSKIWNGKKNDGLPPANAQQHPPAMCSICPRF